MLGKGDTCLNRGTPRSSGSDDAIHAASSRLLARTRRGPALFLRAPPSLRAVTLRRKSGDAAAEETECAEDVHGGIGCIEAGSRDEGDGKVRAG